MVIDGLVDKLIQYNAGRKGLVDDVVIQATKPEILHRIKKYREYLKAKEKHANTKSKEYLDEIAIQRKLIKRKLRVSEYFSKNIIISHLLFM